MASPLSDLDELVLKCRDEKAKGYIKESVSCYKAGAFRSAIVSTWIAVIFDIVDKLRDLSLTGDKEAEKQLEEFEKARKEGDIAKSLKFERDILIIARDKLELISHLEFIDLNRLQEDRNRCAHPSMTSDSDIFNPSAELARVHIRSAVEYLLQYPPAQGKLALDVLIKEINSEYFPIDKDKALTALKSSPLNKGRESLVRNLIIILLKKLLDDSKDWKFKRRIIAALNAIEEINGTIYYATINAKLSGLIKILTDTEFNRVFFILKGLKGCWEFLDSDVRHKLEAFVEDLPSDDIDELEFLLADKNLVSYAKKRLNKTTRKELKNSLFFDLPVLIGHHIVKLYVISSSYEQANSFASTIKMYASEFSKDQIEKIIKACGENNEIKNSFEISSVISAMRKNKHITEIEINNWLTEVDLLEYITTSDEDFPPL